MDASIIMITHDLGVIAEMCDRVLVMYAGNIVESAEVFELFDNPRHPYTQGLLSSIPNVEINKSRQKRLTTIKGFVPHPANFPKGCRFHPRCPYAFERCVESNPQLLSIMGNSEHFARCWLEEAGDHR
jgi:oligopeptide/dipeptide ABC transporter ATP-binding protein